MEATPGALARALFDEVFTGRDLDRCDELFAHDFVEHALAPFGTDPPGAVDGPAHMRGVVSWLTDQFPDLRMTVEQVVADGPNVAVRVRATGTNLGRLNGVLPPTGRTFEADQSHWYRVEGGRFVEHWVTRDDLTSFVQLGVVPGPRPRSSPPG